MFQDATDQTAEVQHGFEIYDLQSHEQEEILNAIDKLRPVNVEADIKIPQIVVCGDQSSGKSSVLEAIAGVRFPVGIKTVTRFATEVVLRRAPEVRSDIKLVASADRSHEHRSQINNFNEEMHISSTEDIPEAIEETIKFLRELDPSNELWSDLLRIELSGPEQAHLTLVDLPGLIHAQVGTAKDGDRVKIKALVQSYLINPRTVVLAIINSAYDLELQEILEFVDHSVRQRTLGVVTRADCLTQGSDMEKEVIKLVKGEKLQCGYGWHAVVNLPHEDVNRSAEHRDHVEGTFFNRGLWSRIKRADVGIHRLRDKLKEYLFRCITTELPQLVAELQFKHDECKTTIDRLGPARESEEQQRQYLSKVLGRLQRLVEAALESDYEKSEFESFFDGHQERSLRDLMRNISDDFAQTMRTRGRQYIIYHQDGYKDRWA